MDKIRDVIGSGGKVIRGIQDETGASIDIQEDGTVFIAGTDGAAQRRRRHRIKAIVKVPEVGEEYDWRASWASSPSAPSSSSLPGKDGLLHISRVAQGRVDKVEDVLAIGDEVKVKVLEVDEKGKISLDRLDKPEVPGGSKGGHGDHHEPRGERRGEHKPRRHPGDNGNVGSGRAPRRHHEG